ncbi:MAG: rod shape-determining protein MreC [Candidatus Levyibacteriota bacterium]
MQKRNLFLPIFFLFLFLSFIVYFLIKFTGFSFFTNTSFALFSPFLHLSFQTKQKVTSVFSNNSMTALQAENAAILSQLAHQKTLEKENEALRDQFALTATILADNLLPAHILAAANFIPNVNEPDDITIDVGRNDGVQIGDTVLYKNIALGLISNVTDHASDIRLITAGTSIVTVKTQDNIIGVLRGQGNGQLLLDNVLLSDKITAGDVVVTSISSQTNATYQQGLLVGKITSIDKNPSSLFQRASIQPFFSVEHLPLVFVLLKHS